LIIGSYAEGITFENCNYIIKCVGNGITYFRKFMSIYIMQPRIIASELKNHFMYNPVASDALFYISIKASLKRRLIIY